ncbi:unnamed protein product [Prorocentrum cordatum]|uniref:Auxin efflux carrier n=1 Tax=Prorocentrum cordatum TaxID=2364126 RepID=A0ABN9VR73_9DINO|nr:unnamed protein product [Polarella glacialis]
MVNVDVLSLFAASVKAVLKIGVVTGAGVLMARWGIITNEGKKCLGELTMTLLIPCLMFTQVADCDVQHIPCANIKSVILGSWVLFLWPLVVVSSGYGLGYLVSKMLRVPQTFARAAAGSVAFGNSTGMPLVLLQALTPSLIANGILEESPLLYLPVYLVLSPVLQWTIGPAIFQAPKLEDGAAPLARDGDGESETASDESDDEGESAERDPVQGDQADTGSSVQSVPQFAPQAEIDDGVTLESIKSGRLMPRKRDGVWTNVSKVLSLFVSPPVLATILGIFFAVVRPMEPLDAFLFPSAEPGSKRVFDWVYQGLRSISNAAVPVQYLLLGANLSKGADFGALPLPTSVALATTKMILQPAVVMCLVWLVSRVVGDNGSAGKWLVAIMVSLTPTANNIMVQAEAGGQDKAALNTLIFTQYMLSPVLLTVSLTATAFMMQVNGFLPSHP